MANQYAEALYKAINSIANNAADQIKQELPNRYICKIIYSSSDAKYFVQPLGTAQQWEISALSNYAIGDIVIVQKTATSDAEIIGYAEEPTELQKFFNFYYETNNKCYDSSGAKNNLLTAQLRGGGDLVWCSIKAKSAGISYGNIEAASVTITIKKDNTAIASKVITVNDVEGNPYDIDDTMRIKIDLPPEGLLKDNSEQYSIEIETIVDNNYFAVDGAWVGRSDNKRFDYSTGFRLVAATQVPGNGEPRFGEINPLVLDYSNQTTYYAKAIFELNGIDVITELAQGTLDNLTYTLNGQTISKVSGKDYVQVDINAYRGKDECYLKATADWTLGNGEVWHLSDSNKVSIQNYPILQLSKNAEETGLEANLIINGTVQADPTIGPWTNRTNPPRVQYNWKCGNITGGVITPTFTPTGGQETDLTKWNCSAFVNNDDSTQHYIGSANLAQGEKGEPGDPGLSYDLVISSSTHKGINQDTDIVIQGNLNGVCQTDAIIYVGNSTVPLTLVNGVGTITAGDIKTNYSKTDIPIVWRKIASLVGNELDSETIDYIGLETTLILTNDSASISYSSTGVPGGSVSSTAELYVNGEKKTSGVSYGWAFTNCTGSANGATVTITGLTANAATATCYAAEVANVKTYTGTIYSGSYSVDDVLYSYRIFNTSFNEGDFIWATKENYTKVYKIAKEKNSYSYLTLEKYPYTKTFNISKIIDGQGTPGSSFATILIYKASTNKPADTDKPGEVTYNFQDHTLTPTGNLNNWDLALPSENPVWMRFATASTTGTTDTIESSEWSTPQKWEAKDGNNGINTATVMLYNHGESAPSRPTGDVTYTFDPPAVSGEGLNNWSLVKPQSSGANDIIWMINASAANREDEDIIPDTEWSTPQRWEAKDGKDGINTASLALYKRAQTSPTQGPTGNLTYTFANGSLTGSTEAFNGWSIDIPAIDNDGNPCYITRASAIGREPTYTVPSSAWSEPIKFVENGSAGPTGATGATGTDSVVYTIEAPATIPRDTKGWYSQPTAGGGNPPNISYPFVIRKHSGSTVSAPGFTSKIILFKQIGSSWTQIPGTLSLSSDNSNITFKYTNSQWKVQLGTLLPAQEISNDITAFKLECYTTDEITLLATQEIPISADYSLSAMLHDWNGGKTVVNGHNILTNQGGFLTVDGQGKATGIVAGKVQFGNYKLQGYLQYNPNQGRYDIFIQAAEDCHLQNDLTLNFYFCKNFDTNEAVPSSGGAQDILFSLSAPRGDYSQNSTIYSLDLNSLSISSALKNNLRSLVDDTNRIAYFGFSPATSSELSSLDSSSEKLYYEQKDFHGLLGLNADEETFRLDASNGQIIAKKGEIAGWTLTPTGLTKGTLGSAGSMCFYPTGTTPTASIAGSDNKTDWRIGVGQNFGVDSNGYLYAAGGGKIAGWTIEPNKLSAGTGSSYVGIAPTGGYAFWAGSPTASSAPFYVTDKGELKASNIESLKILDTDIYAFNRGALYARGTYSATLNIKKDGGNDTIIAYISNKNFPNPYDSVYIYGTSFKGDFKSSPYEGTQISEMRDSPSSFTYSYRYPPTEIYFGIGNLNYRIFDIKTVAFSDLTTSYKSFSFNFHNFSSLFFEGDLCPGLNEDEPPFNLGSLSFPWACLYTSNIYITDFLKYQNSGKVQIGNVYISSITGSSYSGTAAFPHRYENYCAGVLAYIAYTGSETTRDATFTSISSYRGIVNTTNITPQGFNYAFTLNNSEKNQKQYILNYIAWGD